MIKTALITGSSSGIGLGIARKLKQEGYTIILNGIEPTEKVQPIATELVADYFAADLSQPEAIETMVNEILAKHESIDVLVNNAGVQHIAPVCDFPLEKWNLILQLNLTAAFLLSKLVLPSMQKKQWGRIINIASAHAMVASPYKAAYVAAKHGLAGLTKVIALEHANDNITCNAVCPGYVLTPLVEKQIPEVAKQKGVSEQAAIDDYFLHVHAKKSFVSIDEVAATVNFLASDAAQSITGVSLPVDAGWTAR